MVTRTIIWASLAARLADSGAYPDGCWHRRHSGSDDLELVWCSCPLHCLSPFEFARCQVCGCHSYSGREVVSRRRWWLRRPQAGRLHGAPTFITTGTWAAQGRRRSLHENERAPASRRRWSGSRSWNTKATERESTALVTCQTSRCATTFGAPCISIDTPYIVLGAPGCARGSQEEAARATPHLPRARRE